MGKHAYEVLDKFAATKQQADSIPTSVLPYYSHLCVCSCAVDFFGSNFYSALRAYNVCCVCVCVYMLLVLLLLCIVVICCCCALFHIGHNTAGRSSMLNDFSIAEIFDVNGSVATICCDTTKLLRYEA